jgi:hypothetical protein
MGGMPLMHLALVVALYLALDVANPLMPGALGLGVQNSVDSHHADRLRVDDVTGPLPPAPTREQVVSLDPATAGLRAAPGAPRVRTPHAPRRTLAPFSTHAAPAPSDDH